MKIKHVFERKKILFRASGEFWKFIIILIVLTIQLMISVRGAFEWRNFGDMTSEYQQKHRRSQAHLLGRGPFWGCCWYVLVCLFVISVVLE